MIVYGEKVTGEQEENAWLVIDRRTPPDGGFTFADLRDALISEGVSVEAAYRAADRMLQKSRKKGEIAFSFGEWVFL